MNPVDFTSPEAAVRSVAAMVSPSDGGPAFPLEQSSALAIATSSTQSRDDATYIAELNRLRAGMSLRDYFAKGAMEAFIVNRRRADDDERVLDIFQVARSAYVLADAMLQARNAP